MRTYFLRLALVAAFVSACDDPSTDANDASDRPSGSDAYDGAATPDVLGVPDAPDATTPDATTPDATSDATPPDATTPDATSDATPDATPDAMSDGGCTPGMTRMCYSGSDATRGVGACRGGIQVCTPAGMFESACFGEVAPASMETCGNGIDDDCNGMVDDACGECAPGSTRDCYTGAVGTVGVGRCRGGRQVCDTARRYGMCTGETTPASMETCGNGIDDNCDGMVDNGCGECTPGTSRACYSGAASTAGVGRCRRGTQVCTPAGAYDDACLGEVVPSSTETCGNGVDDDCNGMTDDGCGVCTPGTSRSCYSGATDTLGVGRCRGGAQVCNAMRAYDATCAGEVIPGTAEVCGNRVDDDCDGAVDNGCGECTPGTSRTCYSGASSTAGVGRCRRGAQVCNPGGAYDAACIGETTPAATETCGNGIDDNCDGMVDNGCGECTPGTSRSCYTGAGDTQGVGRCRGGAQVCNASRAYDTACTGEVTPAASEVCGNGVDDNCDGVIDNGCGECAPGTSRTCYTGAAGTAGVGRCARGLQLCNALSAYDTACLGEVTPASSETCGNGIDDNCDGMVDNGCGVCTPGTTRACYTGASDTQGVGRCRGGTQVCNASRAYDAACTGEVTPASSETCGNGVDDDCDGMTDEGCGVCTPGTTRTCYSGPSGTAGVGRCAGGLQLCNASGAYDTACLGEVTPASSETCGNGVDDNCDGMADNGCGVCTPGSTRACYTGAADTQGVGRCRGGTQVCNASRTYDATCTGEVTPASSETCGNGIDDDCDGMTDEGCGECTPGTSRSCYTGASGTAGVGRCVRGLQLCNASGAYDTACLGQVTPAAETCGNGVDDNCDGTVDDGCGECVPGASRVCYSGPSGTSGRGLCRAGTQVCGTDRAWSTSCVGEVLPVTETCNGSDDDCDGVVDDSPAASSCSLANATAACASGACAVAACSPSYGDCDGVASNGCEVLLTTSAANCGTCGRACGAGQTCTGGVCLSTATGVGSTIAFGAAHGCAVLPDGRVLCWGVNDTGQLGTGSLVNRSSPQFVTGLSDAVSVSAGSNFTCALRASGAVSCWGRGLSGQLGDGASTDRTTAVDATGIVDALQVSAGGTHACAVRRTGRVLCWGSNSNGQLGDGTTAARPVPSEVPGITDAVRVSASGTHTCVVHASGAVSCWGFNGYAALGDGTGTSRTRPTVVLGLAGAVDVVASTYHTCAVRAAGTVACWGTGTAGQLGDGSLGLTRATPAEVTSMSDAVEITAGTEYTCVRRRDGAMSCWGGNTSGQLGDGTVNQRSTPVAVTSFTGVARIGAGATTTCATRTDGTAICWGAGSSGELGDGRLTTVFRPTYPIFGVPGAQTCSGTGCALSLAAGDLHGCSVRPDGAAACWGGAGFSQLGDSSAINRAAAVAVTGLTGATQVVGGADFSCARLATGALRCWGANGAGQLGDGTTTSRATPVAVSVVTDAVEVSTANGAQHACARTAAGTIYCWGLNSSGQLGDGSTGSRVIPTLAGGGGSPIGDATGVAAGGSHTCAIRAAGAVWCWGLNTSGQLGDGTLTNRTLPVAVRAPDGGTGSLTGVSQVAVGPTNTCALRSGTVICWGDNTLGQLGNGGTLARSDPGTVPGITDAVEVRVGQAHVCARRASGAVLCWGRNSSGQIGDGTTTTPRTSPTSATGLTDVIGIATGALNTCARRASGAVVCWGRNGNGQLANGTFTDASSPGLPIVGLP